MDENSTDELIRAFWSRMASNDFAYAAELFAAEFTLEWPQTKERIRGASAFVRINSDYPAQGRWSFEIVDVFASIACGVSRVWVSDGARRDLAISYFDCRDGAIVRVVEYWPAPSAAGSDRAQWVERLEPSLVVAT